MKVKKKILYIFWGLFLAIHLTAQNNKEIDSLKKAVESIYLKDFDNSVFLSKKGAELAIKNKDTISYSFFKRHLGSIYYFKGDYSKASSYYFESIKFLEKTSEKKELAYSYNELAKLYRKTRKLNLAKENYDKALNIFTELNDSSNISMIYNESGVVYEYENNYDEALKRYFISYRISEKMHDSIAISYALNNIAGLYLLQNKFNIAHTYLIKALQIRKLLKDNFAIALNYTDLASSSFSNKHYGDALNYIDSSNIIAKQLNYLELESQNYLMASKVYEEQDNSTNALNYFKKHISLKDSIFTQESEKQLQELNTKYQTEKKDLEISKSKIEIENEKNKRFVTYGALALIVTILLFVIWAFIQKRKNNQLLEQKNELLQDANQKIFHQKEQLAKKQKEILDSINYAQKIQNALLASEELLLEHFINHFILFKPKDIVSGDFTWATRKDNLFYLACCDSTGHGVPGAFMSLLNIGFLSEGIKERNITEPGKIFDYVRNRLIETIGNDEQKDGFDGILLCIDITNKKITYAASNNAPVIIRGGELNHLQADKMPVGKGIKQDNFKTFDLNYHSGDSFYLYTDGFADQFGGPKGKKFKYKQLEDLLLSNHQLQPKEQALILDQQFELWKGKLEQVDDVCIIGIKM